MVAVSHTESGHKYLSSNFHCSCGSKFYFVDLRSLFDNIQFTCSFEALEAYRHFSNSKEMYCLHLVILVAWLQPIIKLALERS